MHKTKKKTAKLPKPIKVKKEKNDEDRLPQPMSHYIDDRLELVKQVFGTLKPKTIINLAPDFLKSQGLEEIEEACLNELLCISTKRLKSIITATKCPSDTESSDDDDVQRREEHVSLEEISSDSEIGGAGTSKKVKKKKSSKMVDKDKTNAKTDKSKTAESGANPEDGQISVLELLELQARARAIRSQLALEPVTKIEVDSDVDDDDKDKDKDKNKDKDKDKDKREQKAKKDKKSNKTSERKRTSSTRESQDSTNTNTKVTEKESERKTKKIKLKRNYRNPSSSIQQREDERKDNDDGQNSEPLKEKDKNPSQENKNNKKQDHDQSEKVKKERSSCSASPDVIPILAETETLLINDSSDEAEVKDNQPNETEDNPKKDDKNVEKEPETTDEATLDSKAAESEEGEMCARTNEDDGDKNPEPSKSPETITEVYEKLTDSCTKAQTEIENSNQSTDSEKIGENDPCKTVNPNIASDHNNSSTSASHPSDDVEEDEDQNDDVISLGEDLEDEMNEQLENEVNGSSFKVENSQLSSSEISKRKPRKEKSKATASEDDNTADNQSWQSRYMKSSKVSKVLAASRLGKRVRDKIKKSKDTPRESVEAGKVEPVFSSKHEDGSLEQYKELLELRNRKSK